MGNKNDRWSALSMKERAEVFKIGIENGVTNRDVIIKIYNSFESGGSKEPLYYDDTYIEPAVVKAFNSTEDYNRYYGDQFGKQIARKRNKVANNIMHALEYTPFVGDGVDIANTIASINEGDYSQAAVLAGLALLPNVIEKPLKAAKKIGRSITHAFSSDYLPTILSDKFGKGVINPSMAVSPITKTFDNLYGDIVLVGDKTLLDDSFLFRGDGDTSAVGLFTDSYDEVRDVHKVSSKMRTIDNNSPVPQLTKEQFLELEAHPEYHEVKRNRVTGLNEFRHALIPETFRADSEMLGYVEEMGIPYSFYSTGNKKQAIDNYINSHPEVLFKEGGSLTNSNTDNNNFSFFDNPYNNLNVLETIVEKEKEPTYVVKDYGDNLNLTSRSLTENEARRLLGIAPIKLSTQNISSKEIQRQLDDMYLISYGYDLNHKDIKQKKDIKTVKDALDIATKDFYKTISKVSILGYTSTLDKSELLPITASNTDISKFIFGNKISKDAINEIKRVAQLRKQDPYDILAHMLIEKSGNEPLKTNSYYNTHDVILGQLPSTVLQFAELSDENKLKQLGIWEPNKKYSVEDILKAASRLSNKRKDAISKLIIPESAIDAVALRMSRNRDFNPAQKGYFNPITNSTVEHSYLDMIDSAISSLKENMPELFK